jgi:hypothetical protein
MNSSKPNKLEVDIAIVIGDDTPYKGIEILRPQDDGCSGGVPILLGKDSTHIIIAGYYRRNIECALHKIKSNCIGNVIDKTTNKDGDLVVYGKVEQSEWDKDVYFIGRDKQGQEMNRFSPGSSGSGGLECLVVLPTLTFDAKGTSVLTLEYEWSHYYCS